MRLKSILQKVSLTAGTSLLMVLSTEADTLINGLGGPAGFGTQSVERNDDGFVGPIDITSVFPGGLDLFGTRYDAIFVNNNGNITLNAGESQFTPSAITGNTDNPIFAPFFADVDTRGQSVQATRGGTSTGSNLVYYDVNPQSRIVTVTWDDVGYFSNHTNRLNAFQLRLINRGGDDFDIEYRYEAINWVTGDASNGSNGLGGTVARAGWSAGDGENFVELPQSGNQARMLGLDSRECVIIFPVRDGVLCSVSPVPSAIDFGGIGIDGSSSRPVRVTNNELTPAVVQAITLVDSGGNPLASDLYEIINDRVTGEELQNGESATFEVRFSPNAIGQSSAKARIAVTCNEAELLLDVDLTGNGAMVLDIPDPVLEACLVATLGRSSGGLTLEEIRQVTSLNLRDKGVQDLTGLELATSLATLDIRGHNFTDLEAAYEIIDDLPLGLLIRNSGRPEGTSDPVFLTSNSFTARDGSTLEALFSAARLPVLDLDAAMIDTNDLDNLELLVNLSIFSGIRIDTGSQNRPPVPDGRITPSADRFNFYNFDARSSADVDGIVDSAQWTWDGGFSTALQFEGALPIGLIEVKMKIRDNVGAEVTQVFTVDNRVPVSEISSISPSGITFSTLIGMNYRLEAVSSLSDEWVPLTGFENIVGDGSPMTVDLTEADGNRFYRVVSILEAP